MEGRMVEEMVAKLMEKMEMVGGGDGRPKGSLALLGCWKQQRRRKKRDEREGKKKEGGGYIRERNIIIFPFH